MTEHQLKLREHYREELRLARINLRRAQMHKLELEVEGREYEKRGEIAPQEWLHDLEAAEAECDKAYDAVYTMLNQLEEFEDSMRE